MSQEEVQARIDRTLQRNAELLANIGGPREKRQEPSHVFVAPPEKRPCPRYPSPRRAKYPCDNDYGEGHLCSDVDGTYLVERCGDGLVARRVER